MAIGTFARRQLSASLLVRHRPSTPGRSPRAPVCVARRCLWRAHTYSTRRRGDSRRESGHNSPRFGPWRDRLTVAARTCAELAQGYHLGTPGSDFCCTFRRRTDWPTTRKWTSPIWQTRTSSQALPPSTFDHCSKHGVQKPGSLPEFRSKSMKSTQSALSSRAGWVLRFCRHRSTPTREWPLSHCRATAPAMSASSPATTDRQPPSIGFVLTSWD